MENGKCEMWNPNNHFNVHLCAGIILSGKQKLYIYLNQQRRRKQKTSRGPGQREKNKAFAGIAPSYLCIFTLGCFFVIYLYTNCLFNFRFFLFIGLDGWIGWKKSIVYPFLFTVSCICGASCLYTFSFRPHSFTHRRTIFVLNRFNMVYANENAACFALN